jgi:hypothetical protein
MNWPDDPATEHQLNLLRNLGFVQARPLTLTEAARLIRKFQKNPGAAVSVQEPIPGRAKSPSPARLDVSLMAGISGQNLPSSALPSGAQPSGIGRVPPSRTPPPPSSGARAFDISESTRMHAHRLRVAVETAKEAMTQKPDAPNVRADLVSAKNNRQEFWLDTCRDVRQMRVASVQVLELYQAFGCRLTEPIASQVQDILDALDPAMPLWDRDHPELFFQALELNFPQLLRLR